MFRTAIFAGVVLSVALWFLPHWLAREARLEAVHRWGGIITLIGLAISLRCFWDFAWNGLGTPAPFDPPRKLVITGLYRFVRNPMYVGMLLIITGEAIVFPVIRIDLLVVVGIFWLAATLFVMLYEEPALQEKFGSDYEAYRREVRRWIPRVTPFRPSS